MSGGGSDVAASGLYVVFGSRTRRGLNHANEDRHGVAEWKNWRTDAHLEAPREDAPFPRPKVVTPLCTGSARKDTTIQGYGATSSLPDDPFNRLDGSGTPREGVSRNPSTVGPHGTEPAFLWTVCDGHDGPEAANFVCKHVGDSFAKIWHSSAGANLPSNLLHQISKPLASSNPPQPTNGAGNQNSAAPTNSNTSTGTGTNLAPPHGASEEIYTRGYALSNALARTFETLDTSFKQEVSEGGPLEACTAGSCVTSIFLNGNLMCCAGLGDCKAAILTLEEAETAVPSSANNPSSTGAVPGGANAGTPSGKPAVSDNSHSANDNKSVDQQTTTTQASTTGSAAAAHKATQQFQVTWFSKEHRSSSPKERARIRARGGWFRHGRVGGVLEPTRTIGDFDVKASQPQGVIIATPEVRTFTVTKPALVLVASDGVWDVMDASQLLRTLKKRRRLWRGILSWLGAPLPEKRSLINFGFRRRAKSKEGFETMFSLPTGGDLCAMAETIVTRAHDLGSDDDCTCVVIYLRPPSRQQHPHDVPALMPGDHDTDILLSSQVPAQQPPESHSPPQSTGPPHVDELSDEDEEEEFEEELEEDDEFEEEEPTKAMGGVLPYSPSADNFSEYEKWRRPSAEEMAAAAAEQQEQDDDEESLFAKVPDAAVPSVAAGPAGRTAADVATFSLALVTTSQGETDALFASSTAIDQQDAPEVIEKARKRREERRQAREKRKKSLEEKVLQRASARIDPSVTMGVPPPASRHQPQPTGGPSNPPKQH